MKAVVMKVLVIDFDNCEKESGVNFYLENGRFPNDCIHPIVLDKEVIDIGEWHDDHPLNIKSTMNDYLKDVMK